MPENTHKNPELIEKTQELVEWISFNLKRSNRFRNNLVLQSIKCSAWNIIQHEGELLQANLYKMKRGMESVSTIDWENDNQEKIISLDPTLEPKEEISKRFNQSKKLKRGFEDIQTLLIKAEKRIHSWSLLLEKTASIPDNATLKALQKEARFPFPTSTPTTKTAPNQEKTEPFFTYQGKDGSIIFVGRNARGNDTLTFQHAKGHDWWLHASGYSGSHVVLRVDKGTIPEQETLLDAAQLALYHSKAKDRGEAEVCITQRKYVSRMGRGSAPGKVQISQHKTIFIRIDLKRIQNIKDRKTEIG